MTGEERVGELRRFFTAEEDPGPLTGLALGDAVGRLSAVPELRKRWREVLGRVAGRRLLELGCGHGGEMAPMTREGAEVIGIDYSIPRLMMARAAAPGALVMVADAERLPFKNGTFSLVYGNSILLHLDRAKAFIEIKKVLEPCGTAVFIEPLNRHPLVRLYRTLFTHRRGLVDYPSLKELERLNLGGAVSVTPWYLTAALPVLWERIFGSSRFMRGLTELLSRFDTHLFRRSRWAASRAWQAFAVYHQE